MSTRATYLFEEIDSRPAVCFYIHHDGYLTGAISYFKAMVEAKCSHAPNSDRASAFIRENESARITNSHEGHSDTEYRYTISGDDENWITCYAMEYKDDTVKKWPCVFAGSVKAFIDIHCS